MPMGSEIPQLPPQMCLHIFQISSRWVLHKGPFVEHARLLAPLIDPPK
jgi:hypothetical protein